ncbi:hypothetical protein JOB18_047921 [Solea senegalensis]|uniref:Uncharacterized protein n=1 Tax=Solea senegalensis TaxID=28829 RepID=A0AAV6PGE6_SOLSE|nr:hypothetical protein JOB18_047921 [Solea senegalensis]
MPSKPAVTGKCQCFKTPPPLMSAAAACALSHVCGAELVRVLSPSSGSSKLVLCTQQDVGTEGEKGRALCTAAPTTQQPTLWCHCSSLPPLSPSPTTPAAAAATHCTASPLSGPALSELQHLKLCSVRKKPRHKDL